MVFSNGLMVVLWVRYGLISNGLIG